MKVLGSFFKSSDASIEESPRLAFTEMQTRFRIRKDPYSPNKVKEETWFNRELR